MQNLNTLNFNNTETGPDKGTEFHDGDQIDTSPDNLSDNVVSLDDVRRQRLGQATRIDAMKFERPHEPTAPERASQHLSVIGGNLELLRSEEAA